MKGPATGPLSFTIADAPSHLPARVLSDGHGICVRLGLPLSPAASRTLASPITLRVSFYLYNQPWEVEAFLSALASVLAMGRIPA